MGWAMPILLGFFIICPVGRGETSLLNSLPGLSMTVLRLVIIFSFVISSAVRYVYLKLDFIENLYRLSQSFT